MSRIVMSLIATTALLMSGCGHAGAGPGTLAASTTPATSGDPSTTPTASGDPGADATTPPPASGDSGVQGIVVVGPPQPLSPASGQPTGRPIAVQIEVWTTSEAPKGAPSQQVSLVLRGASGSDGRFRIILPPGRYTLTPVSTDRLLRAVSVMVTVQARHFTTVVLELDNGMR
jgi:hypothetical protein